MDDLHDANAEQPIVCTIRAGDEEPDLVARYQGLFAEAYAGRERLADGVRWRFLAGAGIEARVRELAAIEQRCCAFLRISVAAGGGEVRWDVCGPDAARAFLDEYYRLPEGVERLRDRLR